jgi:hypothetical protein
MLVEVKKVGLFAKKFIEIKMIWPFVEKLVATGKELVSVVSSRFNKERAFNVNLRLDKPKW